MLADKSHPGEAVSIQLSDLYVRLEDFREDGTTESLLKVLRLIWDLRASMDTFDRSAVAILRRADVSWADIAASLGISSEDALERFRSAEGGFGETRRYLAPWIVPSVTPADDNALKIGAVYTRNDLREIFGIRDAGLNNGVFRVKDRREVWLFVTENKQADREQYVDRLVADVLYWQGQRLGRTDPLIIGHKRSEETLLLFYRRAKYEFDGAGFRYEGPFEYVSHSGGLPTSFVLRRQSAR